MRKTPKVLFLSTGNCTRSQMAQGFLRALAGESHALAVSAGISPEPPNPLAAEVMREAGVDISGQTSKDVADSLKEHFAYVISICDATKERFPIFPFTLNLLQWSLTDPATANGSHMQKIEVFRRVRDEIKAKVQVFLEQTLRNPQTMTILAGR